MSDIHRMPLVPRDLPAYRQDIGTGDWRVAEQREKVRIYRDDSGYWRWYHYCHRAYRGSRIYYDGVVGFTSWKGAYVGALKHAKECCDE